MEELARLAMTAMIRRLSGRAIATTSAIRRCPTRQRSSLNEARPARSLGVVPRFSCIWLADAVGPVWITTIRPQVPVLGWHRVVVNTSRNPDRSTRQKWDFNECRGARYMALDER